MTRARIGTALAIVGMKIHRPVALLSAVIVCHSVSAAGAVYQWEDEKGQVHFSDTVPDKYKRTARRIDVSGSDVSPEQLRAAQAQADALKARAAAAPASAPVAPARQTRTSGPGTRSAASGPPPNLSDCATWRSAFLASRDCYASYQTNRGPLKQGAAQACGPEIPNPEPKCGPEN